MKKLGIIILAFVLIAIIFFSIPLIKKLNSNKSFESSIQSENLNLHNQSQKINSDNIPKIVHNNFIELNKISKISKFRSGVGHDFSKAPNETNNCRSMKHYFEQKGVGDEFYHKNTSKEEWPLVKYFAPVSGIIIDMHSATNMYGDKENQFLLKSEENPLIVFGFFHVITIPELKIGTKLKAGDFLGTISPGNSGEIVVSINFDSPSEQLISYFEIIDDNVFSEYKARGANSRQDFIISKQQRDLNPLICSNEMPYRFIGSKEIPNNKSKYDNWASSSENWIFLN